MPTPDHDVSRRGIVPVGFITGQLRNVRIRGEIEARVSEIRTLPTGVVTFLLADIEDSTGLVRHLGDRYPGLLLHQLRGLPGPEALIQAEALDLASEFPSPRTPATPAERST